MAEVSCNAFLTPNVLRSNYDLVQSTDDRCVHQLLHDLAVDLLPNLAETAKLKAGNRG